VDAASAEVRPDARKLEAVSRSGRVGDIDPARKPTLSRRRDCGRLLRLAEASLRHALGGELARDPALAPVGFALALERAAVLRR
jgi:hypothetical protein